MLALYVASSQIHVETCPTRYTYRQICMDALLSMVAWRHGIALIIQDCECASISIVLIETYEYGLLGYSGIHIYTSLLFNSRGLSSNYLVSAIRLFSSTIKPYKYEYHEYGSVKTLTISFDLERISHIKRST